MSDYSVLNEKADGAIAELVDLNQDWPADGDYFDCQSGPEFEYLCAANPVVIKALIAENERLAANVKLNLCDHPAVHWGDVDLLVASVSGASQIELAKVHGCTPPNISRKIRRVKGRLGWREGMSVVEIRARAEQLRALASQGAVVTADLMAERDQLKAENEALRDDIEQNQYDANAWRNGEESVWIEVFNSEGDDPFISSITGQITVEQLGLIQAEILEYREDYFEKGSGLYVFRCAHYQAHHDNVGMTEPAHWEADFESYSAFPWEEEGAAMGKGEQS